ncbi:gala protein [Streptomyces sp. NPDC089795]|uniref:gala protein n=1 Tax=Streptomyces sp. NPDC089795 TaxID=3155297 RepID=UPI0034466A4E
MTRPTPVRCPAEHPDLPPADPALLDPLLARLAADRPVETDETFPLDTLRADGRVDLCEQGLGPAGAARLLPAATASAHARHVLLCTNAIGDSGAGALAGALTGDHGLHTLCLGSNRIGPDGVGSLVRALGDDTTVRALRLTRNPFFVDGARTPTALLRRNTALRTLDPVDTGIGADGLRLPLDALLEREQPLERLFLGGNGLGDEGTAILAAAAADSAHPVRLGLGGNGLGAAGARARRSPADRTAYAALTNSDPATPNTLRGSLAGTARYRLRERVPGIQVSSVSPSSRSSRMPSTAATPPCHAYVPLRANALTYG